jgi:putative transposase
MTTVYLTVFLYIFSRKAIVYCSAQTLETSVCLFALRMAIAKRRPLQKVMHHSDRGVHYASQEYGYPAQKRLPYFIEQVYNL